MQPRRHHYIEYEILRLTFQATEPAGLGTSLPNLQATIRELVTDAGDREIVDALRRLHPENLTIWKYNGGTLGKFSPEQTDGEFFYTGSFYLQRTPRTDPYMQELAAMFPTPNEDPIPKRYGFLK